MTLSRFTAMPHARAAASFEPSANTCRPKTVLRSTRVMMSASAAASHTPGATSIHGCGGKVTASPFTQHHGQVRDRKIAFGRTCHERKKQHHDAEPDERPQCAQPAPAETTARGGRGGGGGGRAHGVNFPGFVIPSVARNLLSVACDQ